MARCGRLGSEASVCWGMGQWGRGRTALLSPRAGIGGQAKWLDAQDGGTCSALSVRQPGQLVSPAQFMGLGLPAQAVIATLQLQDTEGIAHDLLCQFGTLHKQLLLVALTGRG